LNSLLTRYKTLWALTDDGESFSTHSSLLQPVIYENERCMIKIAMAEEEYRGNAMMNLMQGNGVAKVLKYDGHAILMERATGGNSLLEMVKNGCDDHASRVICGVVQKLHATKQPFPAGSVPLEVWFKELEPGAAKYGGVLAESSKIAIELVNNQKDIVALHGDVHHSNILDFGDKGWLAIDPKGLVGERAFDYVNIFCNPDAAIATTPGRLARQVKIVSKAAKIHPTRLVQWIMAWAGLSAAWGLNDGENADATLQIAEIASAELSKIG
jgi:streptomycin 6-kinase